MPEVNDTGDMILKATPPRPPQIFLPRPRLSSGSNEFRGRPVILVEAPAGFGKSSLLAQWRREFLADGEAVAWLTAEDIDEPQRFAQALIVAFRTGAGRLQFGRALHETAGQRGLEDVTLWLAEVARTAIRAVLIIDRANLLPPRSREALAYLLRNLPPNLRAVVSSREDCQLGIDDLVAYGRCAVIGPSMLQFRLEETARMLQEWFGTAAAPEVAGKLQELTEGWPLGLQLALSIIERSGDLRSGVEALEQRGGSSHARFLSLLLSDLDPEDVALLTRISVLDDVHPDLCAHMVGAADLREPLQRIARATPVFAVAERSDWLRMHSFVRSELRRRFAALPPDEQSELHSRASNWLVEHGLVEAAALHALASGENERAYELAERSLYEALIHRGRQGSVHNLLSRLSAEDLDNRPRLLLTAAWSLAISERHVEAGSMVARLLAKPDVDDALRCECALIQSGGAIFADDPDGFARQFAPWSESPPLRDPLMLHIHANRSGFLALIEGDAALARLRLKRIAQYELGVAHAYLNWWTELVVGLTHLWEGQALRAEESLAPKLAQIDLELGRRHPLAAMTAAVLAAALWERDRPDLAETCLTDRLDVLESSGAPEMVLLGYRTLGRMAWARGAEHRAFELLGGMHAVGRARNLPRLSVVSLAEQVRLHSHHYRASTCSSLCDRIDEILRDPSVPQGRLWRQSTMVLADAARGFARIAAQDWRGAFEPLQQAEAVAQKLRLGRLRIEIMGLRAFALSRAGVDSLDLLREAADLARSCGLQRVFADAHPALGQWIVAVAGGHGSGSDSSESAITPQVRAASQPPSPERAAPSAALTPKEREVLELLARNLSNKEIGNALQVGEETIKWHVKNLCAKLDATSRKQAVMRARLLGFLGAAY